MPPYEFSRFCDYTSPLLTHDSCRAIVCQWLFILWLMQRHFFYKFLLRNALASGRHLWIVTRLTHSSDEHKVKNYFYVKKIYFLLGPNLHICIIFCWSPMTRKINYWKKGVFSSGHQDHLCKLSPDIHFHWNWAYLKFPYCFLNDMIDAFSFLWIAMFAFFKRSGYAANKSLNFLLTYSQLKFLNV